MTEVATVTAPAEAVLVNSTVEATLQQELANLGTAGEAVYNSITGDSWEDKLATFAAVSESSSARDTAGTVIALQNIIIQAVELVERDVRGEPIMVNDGQGNLVESTVTAPRVTLIDADGTAYTATSGGVYRSIKNLLNIFKHPSTWPAPIDIVIKEVAGRGANRYMTVQLAGAIKAPAKSKASA